MASSTCYQVRSLATELADRALHEDDSLHALAQGDAAALRDAYRQHNASVRAFARRLLGSDADAEEIVQDVFIDLPRAVRGFRGDCTLATFIMSVAVNHARHFMRAAGRRRAAHARLAEAQRALSAPAPQHSAELEELARRLLGAMAKLPDELRLAFVLCDVEERTSEEAGRILDVRPSTLRSRLTAARAALRELLREEAP